MLIAIVEQFCIKILSTIFLFFRVHWNLRSPRVFSMHLKLQSVFTKSITAKQDFRFDQRFLGKKKFPNAKSIFLFRFVNHAVSQPFFEAKRNMSENGWSSLVSKRFKFERITDFNKSWKKTSEYFVIRQKTVIWTFFNKTDVFFF